MNFVLGTFSYQFQTVGTYYYYTPPVDSSGLISMRGVITVVAAQPLTLTAQVSSSGTFTGNYLFFLSLKIFIFIHLFSFYLSSIMCFPIYIQFSHIFSMYNS
jgi:hypothetical protein